MKTISFLKNAINIYYYFIIIAFAAGLITLPLLLFTDKSYKISLFGYQVDIGTLGIGKSILIIIVLTIVLYFYFRAIQLMKTTVKTLEFGHYFSKNVIKNFKKMGILFLFCGIGFFVFNIILAFLLENRFSVSFNSSLFLFIIFGLFFLFLSEAFKVAKEAKEENDLTI